jgi:hypothetical protein
MDAVDKFEPERGLQFQTYAVSRIRGAIVDGLRSADWVPRSVRERIRDIDAAQARLEARLGRMPTDQEVAEDLELSVENLTTRVHLTEGLPVLLTASATVANGGTMSMFVTVDPFEEGLTFSGRVALLGLRTADLYRFVEPATNLQAPEGSVDMFIDFDCQNGELTGGVKPVLKNVKIRPDEKGLFTVLKAWVADTAVKLVSDRVPGRNAVTTVVPIRGTLSGPDIQIWPAVFGVMRNAFVQGLTSGFAYLPPPTAESKEGVVTQGVKALTGSAPPRAQPTEGAPSGAPATKP